MHFSLAFLALLSVPAVYGATWNVQCQPTYHNAALGFAMNTSPQCSSLGRCSGGVYTPPAGANPASCPCHCEHKDANKENVNPNHGQSSAGTGGAGGTGILTPHRNHRRALAQAHEELLDFVLARREALAEAEADAYADAEWDYTY